MDYFPKGSLYEVMKSAPNVMTFDLAMKFLHQMVSAVNVLHTHEPTILHRDIKSKNWLITDEWDIVLCDFNVALKMADNDPRLLQCVGTPGYCPPEVILGQGASPAGDIYSLGVCMWEVINCAITGKYSKPYHDVEKDKYNVRILLQTAYEHRRPPVPVDCPERLGSLLRKCFSASPQERPTATQLLEEINLFNVERSSQELKANHRTFADKYLQILPISATLSSSFDQSDACAPSVSSSSIQLEDKPL
jgi:serine/threonine-protein kinase CTR1